MGSGEDFAVGSASLGKRMGPGAADGGRAPLRILYASGLSENDSSMYRLWALERLGHTVIPLNAFEYLPKNKLVEKIVYRLAAGPWVERLNRDLLKLAEREQPDLVWTDKLLGMQPRTAEEAIRDGGFT
jgi:spore maturation protein CgeB